MKKMLLFLIPILLLSGCGQDNGMTRIRITADDYQAEKINLAWFDAAGEMHVEELPVTDGRAEFELDIPEGTEITLANLDPRNSIAMEQGFIPGPQFKFYAEKGTVDIAFDAAHWPAATIKGGRMNSDLNRYWKEAGPLEAGSFETTRKLMKILAEGGEVKPDPEAMAVDQAQRQLKKDFIAANPNSIVALDLVAQIKHDYELDEFEALLNTLGADLQATDKWKAMAEEITVQKSVAPGAMAPDFVKKDADGNRVALADHRGKYVLLDFWGSWCGPCRQSHPHLIALHEKYSSHGLVFINIAQEGGNNQRETWLKAVEEDGLTWTQVLNSEGQEEYDVVKLYAIQGFPTKILIGPDGRIIETWLGDVEEIDAVLEGIYGF